MARSSSAALPACLAALAVCGALLRCLPGKQAETAFVPPQSLRGQAAAGAAAAALLAASVAGPAPAEAISAKFSVLGFGDALSDPYVANDVDAVSPYSQFSNPAKAIYKKGTDDAVQRKKDNLADSFKRLEKVPQFIRAKKGEEVKSTLTLQLYTMRSNMEYLSGERESPAFTKAREFFQDVADTGVGALNKDWSLAQESYDKAMNKLTVWKTMVNY
mmetsp:Transcript_16443/g.51665  ORF Transcript_16443/g.51665 Transcript_16443/m.51665 type:complete len:217 (-) Transcript_16443:88-738(-)